MSKFPRPREKCIEDSTTGILDQWKISSCDFFNNVRFTEVGWQN